MNRQPIHPRKDRPIDRQATRHKERGNRKEKKMDTKKERYLIASVAKTRRSLSDIPRQL